MCLGCSKEPSHRDGSFEYPQYMFWLRNKKNNFLLHTLIWGPARSRYLAQLDTAAWLFRGGFCTYAINTKFFCISSQNCGSICVSVRDSYKDVSSLHLPNERFSPVRRASDSLANSNIHKYQLCNLEKLYNQTVTSQQPVPRQSSPTSLKQLQQECQELQVREPVSKNQSVIV